jgi:hypothetical protein
MVDVIPTLDTNAYSANDRLGSIQTLTGMGPAGFQGAILESVTVVDRDGQSPVMTILFFDSLPTVASADNAALQIADAQLSKCIGHVSIASGDWITATDANVASKVVSPGLPLTPSPNGVRQTVYAVVKLTSGTPTFTAAGLTFRYCFRWDV